MQMLKKLILTVPLFCLLGFLGSLKAEKAESETLGQPVPPDQLYSKRQVVTIQMQGGGKIEILLFDKIAPATVENFVKLTKKGFYNGLTFHRVEPNFVVQGGDPKGNGTGGPGYTIKAEFSNKVKHLEGTVAMARAQDPNSAGSQFYICLAPQPFLDGKYTVFGQVVKGMDVVKKIKIGDVMKKVTVKTEGAKTPAVKKK